MELMQALEKIREERQLGVPAFALLLGVTREHYYMMLSGNRPVGEKLRAGVLRELPDLAPLVMKSYEQVA